MLVCLIVFDSVDMLIVFDSMSMYEKLKKKKNTHTHTPLTYKAKKEHRTSVSQMSYRGFGLDTAHGGQKKPYAEMTPEEQAEEGAKQMIEFMSSCPGKAAMSGVTGFGLGGVFGLFMASMSYDVPMGNNAAGHISNLPFKEQVRLQFSDVGKRAWSSAKNFGYIGMIYAGVECGVESLRAKNDIYNGVAAGCITGGGLAYKSGPQAAAIGCAGFAAFSTAIDLYMKMDSGKPPSDDYDE